MKENRKHLGSVTKLLFGVAVLLMISAPSWGQTEQTTGCGLGAQPSAGSLTAAGVTNNTLVGSDTGAFAFNAGASQSVGGCWQEFVYKSDAAGGYVFVYNFSVLTSPNDQVGAFSANGFGSTTVTGSGENAVGLTNAIAASATGMVSGTFVAQYPLVGTDPTAGTQSEWFYIDTTATSYEGGTLNLQDGGNISENDLAPGPEPASMGLFGSGLLLIGAIFRKKLGLGQPA